MPKYKKILYPTDFSRTAEAAARHALDLAVQNAARVHVLHVMDTRYTGPEYLLGLPDLQEFLDELQEQVRAEMDRLTSRRRFQEARVTTAVVEGTPAHEILRYAVENKVDLIVMGTHGRSGLEHILLGSTAEKVVRQAPCPVLTVRNTEQAPRETGGAKPSTKSAPAKKKRRASKK